MLYLLCYELCLQINKYIQTQYIQVYAYKIYTSSIHKVKLYWRLSWDATVIETWRSCYHGGHGLKPPSAKTPENFSLVFVFDLLAETLLCFGAWFHKMGRNYDYQKWHVLTINCNSCQLTNFHMYFCNNLKKNCSFILYFPMNLQNNCTFTRIFKTYILKI